MDFKSTLNNYKNVINNGIKELLPKTNAHPPRIHEAMHYSLQNGGKRIRPTLLLAAYELYPKTTIDPIPAAVAVECLHTYSLIHDDLPCMDNSVLRRGHPTNHIQFDEATALLAGDALLTYSFYLLSKHYTQAPTVACALVTALSDAAGSTKLIGGQIEDLNLTKTPPSAEKLDYIHKSKTAALFSCSLAMGLIIAQAPEEKISIAKDLGVQLGLAFQAIDDILETTSTAESLGKTSGLDDLNETLTYPKFYGIEKSKKLASTFTNSAIELCKKLGGNNDFLFSLVESLEHRVS